MRCDYLSKHSIYFSFSNLFRIRFFLFFSTLFSFVNMCDCFNAQWRSRYFRVLVNRLIPLFYLNAQQTDTQGRILVDTQQAARKKINNRIIGNLFTHKIGQFFRLFRTDDAMEDCGFLKFTDTSMKATFLQTLSTMRKNRLFCDVIINVSFSFSQFYSHSELFGGGTRTIRIYMYYSLASDIQ